MITGSTGSHLANPLVKIARNAAADMLRFAAEFDREAQARYRLLEEALKQQESVS